MPDKDEIKRLGTFPHLRRGAHNAIHACLGVRESDVVTLICDEESLSVGAAVIEAIEEIGCGCHAFILERLAPRPIINAPGQILRAVARSTVSIYVVQPKEGEWAHRKEIVDLVAPNKIRHAHMINITEDVLCQGMLSDYERIARLNPLIIEELQKASQIRVTSGAGTDVTVVLDPEEEWESSAGIILPGRWDNLPNGEVLTCPKTVDGVFVCDGLVPTTEQVDRIELARHPLRLEIEKGRIRQITGGPGDLGQRVQRIIDVGTNMDRIGMFAVGTNFDLLMPIGNPVQDIFIPGAYFSMGRLPHWQQPTWTASGLRHFTGRRTSLLLDGHFAIKDGRFDQSLLAKTR